MSLASLTQHLGQRIKVESQVNCAKLFAKNTEEIWFTLGHFESEGYIKGKVTSLPTEITITGKGLSRVADLQRGLFGPENKQVFVAMSFHASMLATYEEGIKPGIKE